MVGKVCRVIRGGLRCRYDWYDRCDGRSVGPATLGADLRDLKYDRCDGRHEGAHGLAPTISQDLRYDRTDWFDRRKGT